MCRPKMAIGCAKVSKYFWKDYYDQSSELYQDSLLKQVGKTINGTEVDVYQLGLIKSSIVNALEVNRSDTLADLCCGNGIITKRVAAVAYKVIGVDFSAGLIDVAMKMNCADNVAYFKFDVVDLRGDFFDQYKKYYMYEALQYFSKKMMAQLLLNMSKINSGALFFIGSIPDKNKLCEYYNTKEKMDYYLAQERKNKPHMGKWWDKSELTVVASQHGFKAYCLSQNSMVYTSYYRFDCLLERV